MARKLGPDEGINRLQHPDCRACKERERVNVGLLAENVQLKKKGGGADDDALKLSEAEAGALVRVWKADLTDREEAEIGAILNRLRASIGGGDADAKAVAARLSDQSISVAEGGSVQCDGVALEELLGWVEEHRKGARTIGDWLTGAMALQEVADEIRSRLTQQSSGGQEEGVTQKDFDRAEQLIAEGKISGGQEGGVGEGADRRG